MIKRFISFLTALSMTLMMFTGMPTSVFSADGQSAAVSVAAPQALPESGELEKQYIEQLFYGEGVSFYKDYGRDHLTGAALELYELLRTKIEAISAGTDDITSFPINMSETFGGKDELEAGVKAAMNALMADLPADFYWYDKTAGYVYFSNQEGTKVTKIIFAISEDYVNPSGGSETVDYGDGTSETYKINVDSSKMAAARTAVQNAQAIAAKYADKSDYEKIIGYKNEICGLVEYNDAAANDNNTPYGDPWQLVWVFDNDTSTNVVCEGYSKAFQYLCDLGGIECYTVSGTIVVDNTNSEPHMWNIVAIDGKSYHVDVTNSDEDTIGEQNELFLKGADGSFDYGCIFYNVGLSSKSIGYTYDDDTINLYSTKILTVSAEDYDPRVSGEISIEVSPKTKSIAVGDTFTLTVDVTATEGFVGIDGSLYFDCNETVISVEDNGSGTVTICGLAEGETDLVVGWEPDENAGITLENPIVDTCAVTVTCGTTPGPSYNLTPSAKEITIGDYQIFTLEGYNGQEPPTWEIDETYVDIITTGVDNNQCKVIGKAATDPTTMLTAKLNGNIVGTAVITVVEAYIPPHRHSLVKHDAVNATCTEDGNTEYWECSECKEKFSDENGENIITGDITIPASGHKWETACDGDCHWNVCAVCGFKDNDSIKDHEYDGGIITKPSTCTDEGEVTYTCKDCGYTKTETMRKLSHDIIGELQYDEDCHWEECRNCHVHLHEEAHIWDGGRENHDENVKIYSCEICGAEKTEAIEPRPDVTGSETTESDVTEPEITNPEDTEPEVTKPEDTEPEESAFSESTAKEETETPAATTAGNTNDGKNEGNMPTGIIISVIPMITALAAAVASKRRK